MAPIGTARSEPPRKPGIGEPFVWLGITNCAVTFLYSSPTQQLNHAGPTIAAAGLILAGTFAALMLGGDELIQSMGFALSFGIFVAAFVMAMFFTPSLTALIGHAAWWPGHGDEARDDAENPAS